MCKNEIFKIICIRDFKNINFGKFPYRTNIVELRIFNFK